MLKLPSALKLRPGKVIPKTKPADVKLNFKKIKAADRAVSNVTSKEVLSHIGTFDIRLGALVDLIMPAIKDKDKTKTNEINSTLVLLDKIINRLIVVWGTALEASDDDPEGLRDTVRGHVAEIRSLFADVKDRLIRLFKHGYNRVQVIKTVHKISQIRTLIGDIRVGWEELMKESIPMNIRDKIKLIREGKILAVEKINNPDYEFYVIVKGNKIESGWEFKQDAQDQIDDNFPSGQKGKVIAKSALKRFGIDPNDDKSWTVGEWWK